MSQLIVNIKDKTFPQRNDQEAFTAIQNLRFEIENHQFVCLVGPSGCGKTTLLNIIAGLDSTFDGRIRDNNKGVSIQSSYVFQTPRLLPWRTVLDNIQLAIGEKGRPTSVIDDLLQSLGLKNCLYKYPQQLSLGMQRRVALARAFSVPSELLLMDEPFVSLDQATARNARKLLLRLWAEQARKVIFVTHDLNEAFELADRILFLSESPSHIIADIPIDMPQLDRSAVDIKKLKEQASIDHPNIRSLL